MRRRRSEASAATLPRHGRDTAATLWPLPHAARAGGGRGERGVSVRRRCENKTHLENGEDDGVLQRTPPAAPLGAIRLLNDWALSRGRGWYSMTER